MSALRSTAKTVSGQTDKTTRLHKCYMRAEKINVSIIEAVFCYIVWFYNAVVNYNLLKERN